MAACRLASSPSQRRLGFAHLRLQVLLVQLRQDLAFGHRVPDIHQQGLDDAVGLGLHLHFRERFDLPPGDHGTGNVSPFGGDDFLRRDWLGLVKNSGSSQSGNYH